MTPRNAASGTPGSASRSAKQATPASSPRFGFTGQIGPAYPISRHCATTTLRGRTTDDGDRARREQPVQVGHASGPERAQHGPADDVPLDLAVPSQMRSTRASRQNRSIGSSSIRPMPPWIWMASSVTNWHISLANTLAIAMSWSVTVPWSSFHAARSVSSSAASSSVSMSASWNDDTLELADRLAELLPVAAHSVAMSSTRRARPTLAAATVQPARAEPLAHQVEAAALLAEDRLAAGTRQPSKTSSLWW